WDLYPSGTVDDVFLETLGHPRSAFDNLISSEQGYILEFSAISATDVLTLPIERDVNIDLVLAEFAESGHCSDLHRWFLETEYEWRPKVRGQLTSKPVMASFGNRYAPQEPQF
ncbi:hypothetical protein, partial [Phenylobacterium sp.]|uniref:hypothetical protein n=1 Tax=Phenylobacterium sp. TaxID=1871053 RepID=UPI0025F22A42